jgi:hypothetical protein
MFLVRSTSDPRGCHNCRPSLHILDLFHCPARGPEHPGIERKQIPRAGKRGPRNDVNRNCIANLCDITRTCDTTLALRLIHFTVALAVS